MDQYSSISWVFTVRSALVRAARTRIFNSSSRSAQPVLVEDAGLRRRVREGAEAWGARGFVARGLRMANHPSSPARRMQVNVTKATRPQLQ